MLPAIRKKHTQSAISILQQDSEYHLNRIKGLVNSKRITEYINNNIKSRVRQIYLELEQEIQSEFDRQDEQENVSKNKSK